MSWSRFGDGSNIYTFPTSRGGVNGGECCACPLNPVNEHTGCPGPFFTSDLDEFLTHIAAHQHAGHHVPPGIADLIRDEWSEYIP